MPAKKETLSDAERAKRIRETAQKIGAEEDPGALEGLFKKVMTKKPSASEVRAVVRPPKRQP